MFNFHKISAVVLFVLLHFAVRGQDNSFSTNFQPMTIARSMEAASSAFLLGITAGVDFATGRYDYKTGVQPPDYSVLYAPIAGLNLDWRIGRGFALQMNALYKVKGDRINMDTWAQNLYAQDLEPSEGGTVSASGYQSTKIGYAEVSLLPVIVIANRYEIGAGGFAAYGLHGQRKSDYTLRYNFDLFPIDDESYKSEIPVEFVTLAPESIDENKLYINRLDYGLFGHLGWRMNPFKLSFNLSYSLKPWEPDSELSSLFFENVNRTYHFDGGLTLSWFFGAK